ncbi:MAG TPA: hypothetical protein VG347_13280 [Verrucomicrobiae bacterium]|nr:hypothetical protein [Verrucomicrobiae bacterium]
MKKFASYLAALVAVTFITSTGRAQDVTTTNEWHGFGDYYHAQEVSVDAFAAGALGEQYITDLSGDTVRRHGSLGAGLGVNYFFLRYLGLGAEASARNTTGKFIESASGNLIARWPICQTGLAPYIFGGAGHGFDPVDQTFGQAGTGLEFRFLRCAGIFTDARYVFPDRTRDYAIVRAGVRVSF